MLIGQELFPDSFRTAIEALKLALKQQDKKLRCSTTYTEMQAAAAKAKPKKSETNPKEPQYFRRTPPPNPRTPRPNPPPRCLHSARRRCLVRFEIETTIKWAQERITVLELQRKDPPTTSSLSHTRALT